jgi:hypothetical protein
MGAYEREDDLRRKSEGQSERDVKSIMKTSSARANLDSASRRICPGRNHTSCAYYFNHRRCRLDEVATAPNAENKWGEVSVRTHPATRRRFSAA